MIARIARLVAVMLKPKSILASHMREDRRLGCRFLQGRRRFPKEWARTNVMSGPKSLQTTAATGKGLGTAPESRTLDRGGERLGIEMMGVGNGLGKRRSVEEVATSVGCGCRRTKVLDTVRSRRQRPYLKDGSKGYNDRPGLCWNPQIRSSPAGNCSCNWGRCLSLGASPWTRDVPERQARFVQARNGCIDS